MIDKFEYLPPIHRKGGADPGHSDWWPRGWWTWVRRSWTSAPQDSPPKMIWGNQNYWNSAEPTEKDSYIGPGNLFPWPEYGAKPIPPEPK